MYALVILLTGCGFLALGRAVDKPRPGNLIAVAVVTAALLYTQYWSSTSWPWSASGCSSPSCVPAGHGHPGGGAVGRAARASAPAACSSCPGCRPSSTSPSTPGRRGRRRRTSPPCINALTGFTDNQGSTLQTGHEPGTPAGRHLLRHAGARRLRRRPARAASSSSTCAPAPGPAASPSWCSARCSPPSPVASSTTSAFSSRYAAVVFLPFLLLVALGTATLLNPKVRVVVVGLAVVAGLHLLGAERHDPAHPGHQRGRRHQRRGQAGRCHRLLPRPARARRSTGRSTIRRSTT